MKFARPRIRNYYISPAGGGGGSRGSSVNQIMNNLFFFFLQKIFKYWNKRITKELTLNLDYWKN